MSESTRPTRVLFVCMGNICRSPLAEGLFRHLADQRGVGDRFVVDSAGTGAWHAGQLPDPRMRKVAARHGVGLASTARQVREADFDGFDHILCMDEDNRECLLEMGGPPVKIHLLLPCDPTTDLHEVPDPYYGGEDGFELVYRLVQSACTALLDALLASAGRSPLPDGGHRT